MFFNKNNWTKTYKAKHFICYHLSWSIEQKTATLFFSSVWIRIYVLHNIYMYIYKLLWFFLTLYILRSKQALHYVYYQMVAPFLCASSRHTHILVDKRSGTIKLNRRNNHFQRFDCFSQFYLTVTYKSIFYQTINHFVVSMGGVWATWTMHFR